MKAFILKKNKISSCFFVQNSIFCSKISKMFKIRVLAKIEEDCARKTFSTTECLLNSFNCVLKHITIRDLLIEKFSILIIPSFGREKGGLTSSCSYSGRLVQHDVETSVQSSKKYRTQPLKNIKTLQEANEHTITTIVILFLVTCISWFKASTDCIASLSVTIVARIKRA